MVEEIFDSLRARLARENLADSVSPSQQQLDTLTDCYQRGQYDQAEKLALSIIQSFPRHQFSWKVLGALYGRKGRKTEELNANQKAVALAPNDAEAHNNLGITFQEMGILEKSEASLRHSLALDFGSAEGHYNLGVTLKAQNNLEEAETSYRQAISIKPDFAEAHSNLGNALRALGRLDEALASYTQAIAFKPDYAEAHRNLTSMKKFDGQDEQYSKMLELYFDEKISEEKRCHINFGLAKACEDLGNFEQAFAHYSEGNELRKKLLNYDINQDLELFRQIKSYYPRIEQNSLESHKLSKDLTPIFIVGMPRSGTTLVEQIISSHSKVTGAGELSYAAQFGTVIANGCSEANDEVLLEFRHKYLEKLKNVSKNNLIVTDKTPQNFLYIGLLAAAFPEVKIIHVKRNPAAVCWANYKQYFASKNLGYCYALDDIINYYSLYENLIEFWTNKLGKRIYNLDYELLTVNQERETRQLINYLGLDWDEKCLSPESNTRSVATASNVQIREKVYQGSSKQWKKYQPFLDGALDGLQSPSVGNEPRS